MAFSLFGKRAPDSDPTDEGNDFGHWDAYLGSGDGEFAGHGLHRSVGQCLVGAAALRIDHPDDLHTHGEVVFDAFLDLAHAVFAGEYLDAEQGRSDDNGFHRRGAANDADVRDAVVGGGGLDAMLREDADI